MRVTGIRKVEDCFDGSSVFRYRFDGRWTREAIAGLEVLGRLAYYPDFPRPFFRVRTEAGFEVKGVEGEDNCRAILMALEEGRPG